MNIRLANKKDINNIINFYKIVVDDISKVKKIDMLWNDEYPFYLIEDYVKNNELYILELYGKIICCFSISSKENSEYVNINWKNKDNYLYLSILAVLPMYQDMGYAKEAINFISNYAVKNNYKSIRLVVYNENKIAIKLYKNMGFNKINNGFWKYKNRVYEAYERIIL